MAGPEVFQPAVRAMFDSAGLPLDRAGVASSDVAWFVPHQANVRIIEVAAGRLNISRERTVVNIGHWGRR